ncbi:MAG: hypothetical protein NTX52_13440 [Planctomycetota bacterium]|nr:hypothetical protein [Planctomycetota bacterium]
MLPGKTNILLSMCFAVILLGWDYVIGAETVADNQYTQLVPSKIESLPKGGTLNLTFKSKIDGSLQPLMVKVPEGYTPQKKWPLLVTLHGLGDGPILATEVKSMVQIGPYGRGSIWFTGIGEQDVFESIEVAKKLFSIDDDRIYLCGFSMGAVATFNLGLRYPDIWAACVPVCGQCEDVDLVENGRHLPFWINAGSKDAVLPAIYSKKAYDKAKQLGFSQWKYTEYPEMAHSFGIDWRQVEEWLLTKRKIVNPKQVLFSTKDLNANRAYWVEITGLKKYGHRAKIEASIDGQTINVTTNNVSGYILRLNNNLVDLDRELEVKENGDTIFKGFLDDRGYFVKAPENNSVFFKRPSLSGPLWDIYSGPSVLVYGTNCGDDALIKAARRCAESFSNPSWMNKVGFRIIPDVSVTKHDIMENNLVLFGNADTNKILAEISGKLPIEMNGNCIVARGVEYSGKNIGYVLIYPNPLNTQKYVAVFSGNTSDAIDCFDRIWPHFNSTPKNIDVGIFEFASEGNTVKWHLREVFESSWNWSGRDFKYLSGQ